MNPFFFLHLPVKQEKDKPVNHDLVTVDDSNHNITEGGEFLDDALRMVDQPLVYTEESVAAGNPDSFF